MRIYVTQKDIDNGRVDARACPIALSLKRRLGGHKKISVLPPSVHIGYGDYGSSNTITLPEEAIDFANSFDEWHTEMKEYGFNPFCAKPLPFSFSLGL